MNLYWCTTLDHDEDWFVVAPNADEAASFHEDEEGYAEGDATAELVVPVPDHLAPPDSGWPDDELLRGLGGELVRTQQPRAVRFGDRVFGEGILEAELRQLADDEFERQGVARLNRTRREPEGT